MNKPNPLGGENDRMSFSLSEDEADDTTDSLDIKPPQAAAFHRKPNRHKLKKSSMPNDTRRVYTKNEQHTRSDDRSKEYRSERPSHRDRDLHHYKDPHKRSSHREKKDRTRDGYSSSSSSVRRPKKDSRPYRDEKMEIDKRSNRGSNPDPPESDQIIEDLRGKLLDKRAMRDSKHSGEPDNKRTRKDRHGRDKEHEKNDPLTQETEKEREEREERRAKLLVAEREMAMRKEVSRRELEARRERHNLEKEKNRMLKEIARKHKQEKPEKGGASTDGEEGEVHDNNDSASESDSDSSSSTSSSSEAETTGKEDTDQENGGGTPESAPPLEKSPRTPVGAPPRRSPQRSPEQSPYRSPSNHDSPPFSDDHDDHLYPHDSPKSDLILKDSLPPYLPAIQGCRSVEEFQCLNRIEEGTYGVVYRARDKKTSDIVALKRLKMEKEKEGFPITSLREINTLLKAQHPNIVTVREIVVGSNMDKIFIVMDYVEHDLKSLMETMKSKKQVFVPGEIKCLMMQLLRAVGHLHDNWILHRDLKTSNLLLSHKGILKVGDFGLAREYGSPLKAYTPIVVTLWYRAPELLLQSKLYTTAIDMWSVGCIFGELLQMEALFSGRSEMDQLNRIFKELGTPNERVWPGYNKLPAIQKITFAEYPVNQLKSRFGTMLSDKGLNLLNSFLTYDPIQRATAEEALKHEYFRELPLPIDPAMFPTWPAKSEQGVKKSNNSPKPPSGGKEYKQLGDTDEEVPSGGFHMGAMERRANALGPGFSLKF